MKKKLKKEFNYIRDRQINVRLSYVQMEKLDEYCKTKRITKSEFIRHTVDNLNIAEAILSPPEE